MSQAERRAELAANLAAVQQRVAAACRRVGRVPEEVTIVAITKTFPASDVRLLAELGVAHVGENRDQEARPKAQECADLGLTWHFVGQLQRNKAGSVAHYADVVESVDRLALVGALDRAAGPVGRMLGVCVQVDLDERPHAAAPGEPGARGGCAPGDLGLLARAVADAEHLRLLGVMAVAPLGVAPQGAFERLAHLHEGLLAEHPGATMRSAGMSGDLEEAVAAGATHVRLGSALLGRRAALK
jgi:pyridoxal phosphate enzyme (YggS family)